MASSAVLFAGAGVASAQQYPPAREGGVSDENAERGQRMSASSGCARFAPGRSVAFGVESEYQQLGTTTADETGEAEATFTVPSNLSNGRHHVVFTGEGVDGETNTVRIPFQVTGTAGAPGQTTNGSALPRTGADQLVPLTVAGLTLVTVGAGIVVLARRRRESPSTLA